MENKTQQDQSFVIKPPPGMSAEDVRGINDWLVNLRRNPAWCHMMEAAQGYADGQLAGVLELESNAERDQRIERVRGMKNIICHLQRFRYYVDGEVAKNNGSASPVDVFG